MQLIQIDSLELQSLKTLLDTLGEIFRPAVRRPSPRSWPGQTALGRDHQSFGIRIERLRDEQFAYFRPVSIGRIDKVNAKLDRPAQNLPRVISIGRPTPYALPRQAHRAKAKPINRKIAGQEKRRFRGTRRR